MPLVDERPTILPTDESRKETLEIASRADGCRVRIDVYSPPGDAISPLPLVLAPHPITWSSEEDYHGGPQGLTRGYHRGYFGLASKHQVIIAMPHGHQHAADRCSLAGPEQIADMAFFIDVLGDHGYEVDLGRVYACGLSMGAQEALVLAGKHPDRIAAVVAFNPIVDLAAWYEELAASDVPEVREYDTVGRIARELGGTPWEVPVAYEERTALNYIDGLAHVPTLVFWSERDLIVPRQNTHHTIPLYRRVKDKDMNSPFAEYNHSRIHGTLGDDQLTRWRLHEWCDYNLALEWLLCHQR